jgi:hypothetical protein
VCVSDVLCHFFGCDSSAIVSLCVKFSHLVKGPELACLETGIHVAGGAPKRKLNPQGLTKATPPPLFTTHTTQAGSKDEKAMEPGGRLVKPTPGLETSTLLLDDHHRSTLIFTPTQLDTTEATTPVSPRRATKATQPNAAEQAPTPKQATAKDRPEPRQFFILFCLSSKQLTLSPSFSHYSHDP